MAINCKGIVLTLLLTWASCQAECPPILNTGTFRIKYNAPPNCEKTTCDYSVTIATNSEDSRFLDFVVEGNAQGWVAIGFSTSGNMPDADVLACALNPSTNNVEIIDTYNAGYSNIRDTEQNVCPHFSNYTNGRISCRYAHLFSSASEPLLYHDFVFTTTSFSRAIITGDEQDKSLNEPYHLLYGASNMSNTANSVVVTLSHHNVMPRVSNDALNLAKDTMLAAAGDRSIGRINTASTTDEPNNAPPTTAAASSNVATHPAIVEKLVPEVFVPLKPIAASEDTNHKTNQRSEKRSPSDVDDTIISPSTNHKFEENVIDNPILSNTLEEHTIPSTISSYIHTTSTTEGPTANSISEMEHTTPTTSSSIPDLTSEEHTPSTADGPTTNSISEMEHIPTTSSSIPDLTSEEEHTTSTADGPTTNSISEMEDTIPTTSSSIPDPTSEEHTTSTADGPTTNSISEMEHTIPTTSSSIADPTSEEHTPSTVDGPTTSSISEMEHTIPTTSSSIPDLTSEEHTPSTADGPTTNSISEMEHTIPTISSSIPDLTSEEHTPSTAGPTTNSISEMEHIPPTTSSSIPDLTSEEEHTTSTADGPTTNSISEMKHTIPTTSSSIADLTSEEHTPSTAGPTTNSISEMEHIPPTTSSSIPDLTSEEEHTPSTADGPTINSISEMEHTIPTTSSSIADLTSEEHTPSTAASSSITGHISEEYTASTDIAIQISELEHTTTVSFVTDHTSVTDPILETFSSSKPTSATPNIIIITPVSPTSEEQSTATTFINDESTTADHVANPTLEMEHTFPTTISSITSYTSTPDPTSEVISSSTLLPGFTPDEADGASLPIVPNTDIDYVPSIASEIVTVLEVNTLTPATNTNMHSSAGCPSSITLGTNQPEFKKTFPSNCNRTTCDYYISIQTSTENPNYLDFVMEASAQGWVAIGFSSTPGMRDADVLACALHPNTKSVTILDTYNMARRYDNVEDSIQDVCPYSTTFSDGRISCTFSRAINTGDAQDKDLHKDYYHLYGAVDDSPVIQDQVVRLSYHSHQIPIVSDETVNIITEISISSTEASNTDGSVTSLPSTASISSSHVTNCPPMPPAGAKYRLQITVAPNCAEPMGCGYFMLGIRTNDYDTSYLDFVLEGDAQGWVAIGFAPEKGMPDADVLACALNPSTNNVEIIDTYNAGYSNIRDTKQNVCPHFSNYTNGRISCSFSRAIITGDEQDKSLNEPYHLLYGAVDAKPSTVKHNTPLQLKYHVGQVPMVTTSRVNPSFHREALNVSAYPVKTKYMLVLSHGILMLVAWPLLATVAIFFASWMKPALPKGAWFQVHRSFMTISLVVAACAFILIFIANKDGIHPGLISFSTGESTAHFAIGVFVMFLHIANPLISVVRCAPDAPRRWIFNITHGSLIGVGAYLLALINIAIGIFILEKDQQHQILWIYVAFIGFLFTLLLVLFVVFTVIAARSKEAPKLGPPLLKPLFNKIKPPLPTNSSVAMVEVVSTPLPNPEAPVPQQDVPKTEKRASEDAPLRWTGFIILLAVMIPMVAVIGIKIAFKDQ